MTEDEMSKECERLFQAGGPRVYTQRFDDDRLRPFSGSAKKAVEQAEPNEQVWARRKKGRVFNFVRVHP